jgi:hypothetical protein
VVRGHSKRAAPVRFRHGQLYSLVKSYGNRIGNLAAAYPDVPWDTTPAGTTYPGMPWEPEKAFWVVAGHYARHGSPA